MQTHEHDAAVLKRPFPMSACIIGRRLLYHVYEKNQSAEKQPPALKLNKLRVAEAVRIEKIF